MNGWDQQRKNRQAQLIQQWKPWRQSTGPKTVEGKSKVSQNSYKGAVREQLRDLAGVLRKNQELIGAEVNQWSLQQVALIQFSIYNEKIGELSASTGI